MTKLEHTLKIIKKAYDAYVKGEGTLASVRTEILGCEAELRERREKNPHFIILDNFEPAIAIKDVLG